jgi:radical SAM superfamily enzyme YgiQ (UPF0313 family)
MYFPLGILYLANVCKKLGYKVHISDMRGGTLQELPPAKFYGFSCTTPEITAAKQMSDFMRSKGIKTIVGGAHPSLMPEDCVGHFDHIVRGEGEAVLPMILSGATKSTFIDAPRITELDWIPYPAWDMVDEPFSRELFPGERYGQGDLAMTVINSRGCPFSCNFCGNIFHAPVTYRSVDNIIGELKQLIKRKVKYIRFEDDNFNNHPDFNNLCLDIQKLDIKWKCHTRSQLVKAPQIALMKWAGCEEIGLGAESADDEVLRINNKKETRTDHARAVKIIKDEGVRVKTYFIAGLPGETEDTFRINQDFFRVSKPDKWTLSTFTPYPGCEIYRHPEKFGIEIIDKDFTKWWNFVEEGFVHKLVNEPREVTWARYKRLYAWLVEGSWQK